MAVSEGVNEWRGGLVAEARKWADRLGLSDPTTAPISTESVSEAVRRAARLEMWESVVSSRYVRVEVRAEKYVPIYFYNNNMTNMEQKIWLCHRLGILEFRKRYSKKYPTTKCIYEDCDEEDTLEHSTVCSENPVKLGGSGGGEMLDYLKRLHSERLKKVGVGVYWL